MTSDDRASPTTHHMLPPTTSESWLEKGKKLPTLWRVSQSVVVAHPDRWKLVPSWCSSSCSSSPSSFACPTLCALRCSPVLTNDQCCSIHLACWGYCFLPSLPSLVCPIVVADNHSTCWHPTHCIGPPSITCSFGLVVAPTPSYAGWIALPL